MSPESLLSVYLLTGSDRPKRSVALKRLRDRSGSDSVELLSADSAPGADVVAAANALGLFGDSGGRAVVVESVEAWRKADVDALRAYLDDPTPDTVLVLVADDLRKDSPLEKLAASKGEVLRYDVPRGGKLVSWVSAQFKEAGVRADGDAARTLVEIVGEDPVALASEVGKFAAWPTEIQSAAARSSSSPLLDARQPTGR